VVLLTLSAPGSAPALGCDAEFGCVFKVERGTLRLTKCYLPPGGASRRLIKTQSFAGL
jgi:hypothetical protein